MAARVSADGPPAAQAAAAQSLFGAELPRAADYARLLTGPGIERGLIGPGEAGRIWERHLLNCAVVAQLIPAGASVADIGSGAGLPGIVLALLLPDARVTLIEPMARRVDFLEECVSALGIGNSEIVRGRAEELAGQLAADVVTSRAVAPLGRLAALSVPLARPGGQVVAIKGGSAAEELSRCRGELRALSINDAAVQTVRGAGDAATESATVVTFTAPVRDAGSRRTRRRK